jgi:RHS repeat-associated protein
MLTAYAFSAASTIPPHSTGKERDSESGNDYFPARYYASSMGRWLSPDWDGPDDPVPYANLDNPQSLNLYAYLSGNPLSHVDPLGHYHCDPDTFERNGDAMELKTGACHYDMSDFPSLAVAVGHHFVDQAVIKAQNAWNSLAGQFFRRWTTGPTKP